MKIAVTTDSGSGISQQEAKELGITVIPMPFSIDEKTYFGDVNITEDAFYEALKPSATIHTSQPELYTIEEIWQELLKEYDAIVHIPLTSGLSSTCQSAIMLASDIDEERVQVVDNRKVSFSQKISVLQALKLIDEGKTASEIKELLEANRDDNTIYIGLETLDFLKAGGRLTPAVAAIGSILKIKPVLTIVEGGHLDTFTRARTKKGIKREIIKALKHDAIEKFNDPEGKNCYFVVAYAGNREEGEVLQMRLLKHFLTVWIILLLLSH